MAQRTIHYLFGETIANRIEIADKKRFLLGSIMPDAIEARDRNQSHFKVRTDSVSYFDFEAFRNQYIRLMLRDDLYLGYYLHLVEDAFYRAFIYQDCFTMPRTPEEVKLLHHDYHILNSYIVHQYGIHNILKKDIILAHEPIARIVPFRIHEFLEELSRDFTEQTDGATVFLTESMLDEFIEAYLPLAIEEIKNLRNGTSALWAMDYAWPRKR